MNKNIRILLKNTSYTFMSNMASFFINALVVLIIPKLIGVSEYGYYQFYILLSTYALYFHFGWCDGIYLRYVGKSYDELDKEMLSSQFKGICIMTLITAGLSMLIILTLISDRNKQWMYITAVFAMIFVTPKTYTSVVMQMINNMKEYSLIILAEKLIYVAILSIMLFIGIRDFKLLILCDVAGKFSAMTIGIYFCRQIIAEKINLSKTKKYISEAVENFRVGIFLLVSNLASILITGVVQFSVEYKWNIETFSKVSLTFNMSKMLLVVINAMSIVLIPMLKHMDENQMRHIYRSVRSILMLVLGAMLIIYYPMKVILIRWLPQYKISLYYMALMFPMCLFESKTALLLNTYFKSLREEKKLCMVNIITVLASIFLSWITVFLLGSLNLSVLSIPFLLAFRCILLENYIGKLLDLKLMKGALLEVLLSTVFIISSWFVDSWLASVVYLTAYLFYVFYIRNDVKTIISEINSNIKIK